MAMNLFLSPNLSAVELNFKEDECSEVSLLSKLAPLMAAGQDSSQQEAP